MGLHLEDSSCERGFVDDHNLQNVESGSGDNKEQEADGWAQDALIPPEVWEEDVLMVDPSPMAVIAMSSQAGVHPAIVAGRVRYLSGNYRFLSQFVGTGEVRRWFEEN